MSHQRDGVWFRYTPEEAEAERRKLLDQVLVPAALEYFKTAPPAVERLHVCVAQYWNDEGIDDVYLTILAASRTADWRTLFDEDETHVADLGFMLWEHVPDAPSLFAAFCEYGSQEEPDEKNYSLFATISRGTEGVTVERQPQVRPWLDGVLCVYGEEGQPAPELAGSDSDKAFFRQLELGPTSGPKPPFWKRWFQ